MLKKIITNPFFVFPFITCLVFWPFTFQLFALKNDALTYYYPVRTLISDALNNGELPLWTPFINMGYPLHADMQSGAWNPVIWIFSFLSNYSLAAFHYELLFYISFAGIGFYFLCKDLGCGKRVAFCMAIAYQFCGFITDSVQFFNCISAACYIPFILLFLRRLITNSKKTDALYLAVFMFLLFTGGYPSFFIIISYTILTFVIYHFIYANTRKKFLRDFLPVAGLAFLIFALLALPAIISFYQHLPAIARGKAQSLSVVLENSMNPTTSFSLLSPFSTTADEGWLNSSILMRNIYMGIIPLLFFIAAFFQKNIFKNREIRLYFFTAIVMLGMAWGEFFFFRQLSYYVLPLMNSFRHPALFRLFAIFFFLLIAAVSMQRWVETKDYSLSVLKKIILSLFTLSLLVAVYSLFTTKGFSLFKINGIANLKTVLAELSFSNRYLIQFPFIAGILLLSYVAIVKKKSTLLAGLILVADMFFATQLNMPVTVFGAKSFKEVEKLISRNQVKFPLPGNASILENSLNSMNENIVTGSNIPFTKRFGRNDYFITPGNLSLQDEFYLSPIKNIVFKNPAFYFADSLVLLRNSREVTDNKIAFTNELSLAGSVIPSRHEQITITKFSANITEAQVSNERDGLLVYQQNNYKGWKILIDEKPANIIPVNVSFMSVKVPSGKHTVRFIYKPTTVINAWYISVFTMIVLLCVFCFNFFSRYLAKKYQRATV